MQQAYFKKLEIQLILINDFIKYYKKGYSIVYGERIKRNEFFIYVQLRKIFYRFTRLIADWEFVLDMAEFSIISHEVKEEILNNNSTFPFQMLFPD